MVHIPLCPTISSPRPCERASWFSTRIYCCQLHFQLVLHRIPKGNKESKSIYHAVPPLMSTYQSYTIDEKDCRGCYEWNGCRLELDSHLVSKDDAKIFKRSYRYTVSPIVLLTHDVWLSEPKYTGTSPTMLDTCWVELALIHLKCDYPRNTSSTIHAHKSSMLSAMQ